MKLKEENNFMSIKIFLTKKMPNLYFFTVRLFKKKHIQENKKVQHTIEEYKKRFGVDLNLENPQSFYEKINYLKLFYFSEDASNYVDKLCVKKILESDGYEDHFAKVLFVSTNLKGIKKFVKQNKSERFVIKFSHIGGAFFWNNGIVKEKNGAFVSMKYLFAAIRHYLKCNYYKETFEWTYKGIKPAVFAEEYLPSLHDEGLKEYKFFCNYGVIKMINVVSGRQDYDNLKEAFTDSNLNKLNAYQSVKTFSQKEIIKPEKFDEMKKFACKFSKQFPLVRVDILVNKDNWYLCEFTFFDCGGFNIFKPDISNFEIGNLFNISSITK